jgi:hypothetical protein
MPCGEASKGRACTFLEHRYKKVPQWVKGHKYPDDVYNYARRAWKNKGVLFEVYEDMICFNNGQR